MSLLGYNYALRFSYAPFCFRRLSFDNNDKTDNYDNNVTKIT